MIIKALFAITSFFSFDHNVRTLLEEKWFPPVLNKQEEEFTVSYRIPPGDDMHIQWTKILFQKMLQDELHHLPNVSPNSPPSQSSMSVGCNECDYFLVQNYLCSTLDTIKQQGFSQELLDRNLQEVRAALNPQNHTDNSTLDKIGLTDFAPITQTLSLENNNICMFDYLTNTTLSGPREFLDLPLSDTEKQLIFKIIHTMASKSVLMLALKKDSLEKKGKKIHHVHPFRFLGYVYTEPRLKGAMNKIEESHFKWNGFIDGYAKKMRNEASQNNLMPYIPSFAKHLNLDQETVTHLVQRADYEGLVRYMFIKS